MWTGAISEDGYGKFKFQWETWRAHRLAFSFWKGDITDDLLVMHSCDTPLCCNPHHLSLGTPKENTDDMIAKGRSKTRKLTAEAVTRLRLDAAGGMRIPQICARYGISSPNAHCVISRRTWKHVV